VPISAFKYHYPRDLEGIYGPSAGEFGGLEYYLFKSQKTGVQMTTRTLGHVIEKYMDLAWLASGQRWSHVEYAGSQTSVWICGGEEHGVAPIGADYGHDNLDTTMSYIRAPRER
jgi:hypothetical protein